MLIAGYNPAELGDILVTMTAPGTGEQTVEKKGQVVAITAADGQLLGYNFLAASAILPELATGVNGNVDLTAAQVAKLNAAIHEAGFTAELTAALTPHFQVGHVEKMEDHPKSDHLHITTVDLGDHKQQIVSGSPNMQANVKVVVANVGTMMPSGSIIWPGALLGVESNGMICSGRELHLKGAPQKPGALILPDDFAPVGAAFDFAKGNELFA